MPRARREPLEVLHEIVEKRQPLSLRDVRYFARCFAAMRDWSKDEMYQVIRDNFDVDSNNKVTIKNDFR